MTNLLMRLYPWNWIPYLLLALVGGWFAYDTFIPVVRMQSEAVTREPDAVVVHMVVRKWRGCRYVKILAYSRDYDSPYRDTTTKRIDMPETGTTKPLGIFDIGIWRIQPITGASHVDVYIQHSCRAGDLRTTKLTEVTL